MSTLSSALHKLGAMIVLLVCGIGIADALLRDNASPALSAPQAESDVQETEEDRTWTLVAGGDIMLSRFVATIIGRESVDYPFEAIVPIVQEADIAFANLENPVGPGLPMPEEGLVFRADPAALQGMVHAGFDIVSLANNHQSDIGQGAIGATVEHVKDAGLLPVGAGADLAGARAPAVFDVKGTRVTFLAYGDPRFVSQVHFATNDKPGIAKAEEEAMKADIALADSQSDLVIVSLHAGAEYRDEPDDVQQDLARIAVEAGADIVLGHHPHVVQPLRQIADAWVAYSMGNLVFDQLWSEETQRGVLLTFTFDGAELQNIEAVPVHMENYVRPVPSTGEIAAATIARLRMPFVQKGDRWYVGVGDSPPQNVRTDAVPL